MNDLALHPDLFGGATPMHVPRSCHVCGCTDDDCSQCIERTGEPCYWVEDEYFLADFPGDICSACFDAGPEWC